MSPGALNKLGKRKVATLFPASFSIRSGVFLLAALGLTFLLNACVAPSWVPFVGESKTKVEDLPGDAEPYAGAEAGAAPAAPAPELSPYGAPAQTTRAAAVPIARTEAIPSPAAAPTEAAAGPYGAPPYPSSVPQGAAVPQGTGAGASGRAIQTTKKTAGLGVASHESYPDKLSGEDEFLKGDYGASLAPLIGAFYEGDIRGAFYARMIYENGLDGAPPDYGEAQRALTMLVLKYKEIARLAMEGPRSKRALYQTAVALLYYRGLVPGSPRDLKKAKSWAEVAADDDFTPAMNLVAAISCEPEPPKILFGLWTPSPKECFKWSMKAAEMGDLLARANLSYIYREGLGTDRDPLRAVNWAHLAATQNPPSARAQNDMGAYHLLGVALSRDPEEARRWFSLAQARYPLAAQNLGRLGGSDPLMESGISY